MATRKKSSTGPLSTALRWTGFAFAAVALVAGGYVWRSYWPLALPFESPLVADGSSGAVDREAEWRRQLEQEASRREEVERERDRLREELNHTRTTVQSKEAEIGDRQIQDLLTRPRGEEGNGG